MPDEKKIKKKRAPSKKKEKIVEYFDIVKDGVEKEIKVVGEEIKNEVVPEKQSKNENKTLRNVLIILGILMVFFFAVYSLKTESTSFQYKGINFDIVKDNGGIAPYKTSLPVNYQGKIVPYNFFLRNDPRSLDNVSFSGEIVFKKLMVMNATDSLNCNGDGIISVANVANLYRILGTKVIKDENATCDSNGAYMFMNINQGDQDKIIQYGPSCYELDVKNCDILRVTEKFMVESLAKVKAVAK